MIKVCENSLVRPLPLLFKSLLTILIFINYGKNQILYQSPKKSMTKQNFENYRLISLLHIFSKAFEKIIFN